MARVHVNTRTTDLTEDPSAACQPPTASHHGGASGHCIESECGHISVSPFNNSWRVPRTDASSLSIQCTLINARSVNNKLPQLRNMICSSESNIICIRSITERWLTENITGGLLDQDMYCRIVRCDRSGR